MSDRRPFWRSPARIALVVSLALNAFVVAALVGWLVAGPGPGGGRGGPGGPAGAALGPFLKEAPPEIRALAREIREARRADFRAARETRRAAFQALREAMRADPFDPQALADAQAQLRDLRAARRARSDDGLLELVTALTPEQRADLADRLERAFARRGPRRGPPD